MRSRIALLLALLAGGCAATQRAPSPPPESGFLTEDGLLRPGASDCDPFEVHSRPGFRLDPGATVYVAPVVVLGVAAEELDAQEREHLSTYARTALIERLREHVEVVETPGIESLVVRAAVTEADCAFAPFEVLSTLLPQAFVVTAVFERVFDSRPFAGAASFEVEVRDAQDAILVQLRDRRIGAKSFRGVFDRWDDAESSLDWWAAYLAGLLGGPVVDGVPERLAPSGTESGPAAAGSAVASAARLRSW